MRDLGRFLRLLRSYLRPHWKAVALLLTTSYVATALAGLLPVVMAAILELALGGATPDSRPAIGWGQLSLGNLGAAVLQWLGAARGGDRFTGVAVLCGIFVVVGVLKGVADFWNYMLALWIRVRAGAAIQLDVFRHLLGLSLGFFNRERSGELVARLWDVTPGGEQTLVTRGVYRVAENQENTTSTITFQLHGNGYEFPAGDTVKLQLLGRDTPYYRASNGTFTIEASNVTVALPTP